MTVAVMKFMFGNPSICNVKPKQMLGLPNRNFITCKSCLERKCTKSSEIDEFFHFVPACISSEYFLECCIPLLSGRFVCPGVDPLRLSEQLSFISGRFLG